jgi:hypothetical protein
MGLSAKGLRDRMIAAFECQDEQLYRGESPEAHTDENPANPKTSPATLETRDDVAREVREQLGSRRLESGVLERLVGSQLSGRDANWARTNWSNLPHPWTRWKVMAACLAAPLVGRLLFPSADIVIEVSAGIILWFAAMPLSIGSWCVFKPVVVGTKVAGWYAFHPLTYWRLSWVILRVDAVRAAMNVPWLVAYALLSLWNSPLEGNERVTILVLVLGATVAFQPLRIVVAFSKNSCDSNRLVLILGGVTMLLFLIATAVGAIALAAGGPQGASFGAAIFALVSMMTWALYGWLYNHVSWDLLRTPSR